ncbi:MAG TPA: hypothetical protein VF681_10775 [Abditibacteriaceae bacterium]|jgi:hypothetical protein
MTLSELCEGALSSLEAFDEATAPLGLYASDELIASAQPKARYLEWSRAIQPYLRALGAACPNNSSLSRNRLSAHADVPIMGTVGFSLVKFSQIKVRKYGSAYHVDKHEDRKERWKETDLSGTISSLWKDPTHWSNFQEHAHVVVFIGFDKATRPLERELSELQATLRWQEKNVDYATRTFEDKVGRGFGIRLATWARVR